MDIKGDYVKKTMIVLEILLSRFLVIGCTDYGNDDETARKAHHQ
ncbi:MULTISPECIES: hypothetical protein [Methanohalophilus]|jgi:hypothetical protein|uniref:Uncharacterized protein n=1 Tax=Methanohalophilus euhalobius TaxID=51203 RepID=A0A314ZW52_9EURY|nr:MULTISPECIES: hypothetical protein [Methanohalophilus]PQV43292.1 hypothetical protein B0H22_10212 [Methanohalophilus euhalobius]